MADPPVLTPSLLQMFFLIRRVAMALVAMGSVVGGGALLWLWFNPERVAGVATLPLVGLLGLFVLPACAIALVRRDRRFRRERAAIARVESRIGADAARDARIVLPGGDAAHERAVA